MWLKKPLNKRKIKLIIVRNEFWDTMLRTMFSTVHWNDIGGNINSACRNLSDSLYPMGKLHFVLDTGTDIKSGQEVIRYEETSKTIDYRIDEIKKRESTSEDLFAEQSQ